MSKYLLMYKSPAGFSMAGMPKDKIAKVMQVWGEWLGSMEPKVIDKGDMFKSGAQTVAQSGVTQTNSQLTGYSIIEASNFDEALSAAKDCPVVQNGGSVEVYEAFGL